MSSISSVSSSFNASLFSSTQRAQRPDPAKMVDQLFSQLDSAGKGYLEKSDLQSAFSQISGTASSSTSAASSSASVDDIFSQLDSNGDGKVTKDEMSSSMQKLADQLDSQFNQMRMSGGMPPPTPPSNNEGFTQDELSSQLSEIGSSDSTRSDLIGKIVNNFAAADTDGNGKVSFAEAQAYDQSTSGTSSTASSSSSSASSSSDSSATSNEQAIMKRIMELMQAYAGNETSSSGTLSVSA